MNKYYLILLIINFILVVFKTDIILAQEIDQSEYIGLLEKTNAQLNLWYNPLILCIGLLGVLFAITAIIFTFILYRQSSDYKKKLDEDRKNHDKEMQSFLDNYKKTIQNREEKAKDLESKTQVIIEEYKKQLESATEIQKKEIQKNIAQLEKEKTSINKTPDTVAVSPEIIPNYMNYAGGVSSLHKCKHCGYGFKIENYDPTSYYTNLSNKRTVRCPSCGSIDEI